MSFRISGQNLDVGSALRDRINDRVAEAMAKYFDGGYSGHLTLARDGFGFRAECAIHLDSKITLHAEGMAPDAYASADQAALRIEKRLRRYHRRLKDHRAERVDDRAAIDAASIAAATYVIAAPEPRGIAADSIRRPPPRRMPIDAGVAAPYGPPPSRRMTRKRATIFGKDHAQ